MFVKQLKKQLVDLLKIEAPSGEEHKVSAFLQPIIKGLVDKFWLDDYGNLLAEKKVGTGKGATWILCKISKKGGK